MHGRSRLVRPGWARGVGGAAIRASLVAALAVPLARIGIVVGQSEPPRRAGLLRELRERLVPPDPAEAWAEARRLPSAAEARPLMEHLARRDAPESSAAALWLGHFFYGAGDLAAALDWFDRARETAREDAGRAEARAWAAHCRSLSESPRSGPAAPASPLSLREALALADVMSAAGEGARARSAYLSLAAEARRAGMLGPLLYRLSQVSPVEGGDPAGWPQGEAAAGIERWGASPERALLRALRPVPSAPAAPPERSVPPAPFAVPVEPAGSDSLPASAAEASAPSPGSGERPAPAAWSIQLGSFADRGRAEREAERLRGLGLPARLEASAEGGAPYRIRWGPFRSREEAEEIARARCTGLTWTLVPPEPAAP